jgi:hypothetical protein
MRDLFTGLFDDAAIFPPGDAPMASAVPAHRDVRTRLGDLVGPFVVPAARLDELTAHLGDGEPFIDPATGFEHHGFLDLLAASGALAAGQPVESAERWLREDDAPSVGTGWSLDRVARARAAFTSFGTCSVLEPVDDLVALGLLPRHDRIPA